MILTQCDVIWPIWVNFIKKWPNWCFPSQKTPNRQFLTNKFAKNSNITILATFHPSYHVLVHYTAILSHFKAYQTAFLVHWVAEGPSICKKKSWMQNIHPLQVKLLSQNGSVKQKWMKNPVYCKKGAPNLGHLELFHCWLLSRNHVWYVIFQCFSHRKPKKSKNSSSFNFWFQPISASSTLLVIIGIWSFMLKTS